MKKFLIAQLAFALVFGSFVLAIIWPAEGWSNVAGVSIWLLNLLAMFTIAMVAGMVHSVRTGVGAKRDDALTALRKFEPSWASTASCAKPGAGCKPSR